MNKSSSALAVMLCLVAGECAQKAEDQRSTLEVALDGAAAGVCIRPDLSPRISSGALDHFCGMAPRHIAPVPKGFQQLETSHSGPDDVHLTVDLIGRHKVSSSTADNCLAVNAPVIVGDRAVVTLLPDPGRINIWLVKDRGRWVIHSGTQDACDI